MRCARTYLVITPGAAIGFCSARRSDRPDFVFVPVGAGLDPASLRHRRQWLLPARWRTAPWHGTSLSEQSELVAVHAPHRVVVQSDTTDPAIGGKRSGLWLDLLGREDS